MLNINELTRLHLGCQGENEAQTIQIDVSEWLKEFPSGLISIWHKRNGDTVPSATGATMDATTGILSWTPTYTDTYVAGEGEAEVRLTQSNVIKKSRNVITGVSPSPTGAGSPLGSGWQDYIDAIEKATQMAYAKDIKEWLDEHPEATTSVEDHSLTFQKLVNGTLDFVTPEMYGAAGNGTTDDSAAIAAASEVAPVMCGSKTYYIGSSINVKNSLIGGKFKLALDAGMTIKKENVLVLGCEFYRTEDPIGEDRGEWMLDVFKVENVLVEGCYFHDATNCIYANRSDNMIVTNNTFKDIKQTYSNGYGVLLLETKNVQIKNNTFLNVARHSIYISHEMSPLLSKKNRNVRVSGNLFKWDENVSGNTTGFETTIMIRPASDVYIENNIFDNQISICTFDRQKILDDSGEEAWGVSERIYIRNNTGSFDKIARNDGVIFMSGAVKTSEVEPEKNIYIEGNTLTIKRQSFVKAESVNGLFISRNRITFDADAFNDVLKFNISSGTKDMIKNIELTGNQITCVQNSNSLIKFEVGSTRKDHGDIILKDNIIKNILCFCIMQGSGNSIDNFVVSHNFIKYNENASRNYMSDCAITTMYAYGNIINKLVSLYIGEPTNVIANDMTLFIPSSRHEETMRGCIYLKNGEVYIKKSTTEWSKISITDVT